jgi:polyhydroxybutyrate depolymerase
MRHLALLVAFICLHLAACGSDVDSGPEPITCDGSGQLAPGLHELTIEHDGLVRDYRVYVPPSYDGTVGTPVVFNFHGFTSDASQQIFFSDMNTSADRDGYIVVYPNGVDNSFNGGWCCGTAAQEDVDDVGFALAILDEVTGMGCVDRHRVYTTGMSNGGFMSHRLGCEAADTFAAIGSVTGALGLIPATDCQPSRPMPVIQLHGTEDSLVDYDTMVVPTMDGWAERNGCDPSPTETFAMGDATCDTYRRCDEGVLVTFCTVDGGGHCWFGQDFCPFGNTSTDLISNDHLWDFFSQFWLE